nr:glycoside hydrolase family 16 protein [Candidatus Krumholzibacteria bacterium]
MKRSLVLMCCLVPMAALAGCGDDDQDSPQVEYGLTWADEFEGPAGQLPDPAKWVFDIGTDWGNLQLEYDTNRPENVSLDGQGNLAITAREESFQGQDYTGGRIKTKGLFEQATGRFEARIKLPEGQGIWPAFWMLGHNIDQVGWPACGEIDIMEFLGHDPRTIYGTIHGPGHSGNGAIGNSHSIGQGGFNLGFHVYAIEWETDRITWYVDGFKYHEVKKGEFPAGATWVYDHPFFMLLNVAVGGRWPGSPDETTQFPQTMLVDYVRVYGELP